MNAPPLPPECPWSSFEPPTMKFCEDTLCAWITTPANTWSNLGYVFAGIALIALARREKLRNPFFVGLTAIGVGVTSFAYHASYTFALQVLDRAGMVLFASLLVTLNLRRLGWTRKQLALAYALLNLAPLTLDISLHRVFPAIGLIGFGGELAAMLVLEWRLARTRAAEASAPPYRFLGIALGIFALAWGVWWLDTTRVWCDPTNHVIQGHAIWHVLGAVCFVPIALFYRQIERNGSADVLQRFAA